MIDFTIYIIKFTVCMILAFLPYYVFMQKSSFFTANRLYLLFAILLSLIIPLFKIYSNQIPVALTVPLLQELPYAGNSAISAISSQLGSSNKGFELSLILPLIYLGTCLLLFVRFTHSLIKLLVAYRRSEIIRQNKMIVLVSEKQHLPFSFFRFVFLCRSDFENENNHLILIHEHAHLRCLHSFDLLLLELLQLLFW